MPPMVAVASVVDRCTASELPTLVQGLSPHFIQLFAGVSAPTLRDLLDAAPEVNDSGATRPILFLRVCPETSGWIAEFSEHEPD